ncbi:MAG: hypothetical protein R3F16_24460 [Myxococcota bacterium]
MSPPSTPRPTGRPARREDASPERPTRPWIGVDFADGHMPRPTRSWLPVMVLALVAALGIVALRIDLIRTRYALSSMLAEEQRLLEEQRALIVRRRQLRDPGELAIQARARGFRAPGRVLVLADPVLPGTDGGERVARPAVAAAPPAPEADVEAREPAAAPAATLAATVPREASR